MNPNAPFTYLLRSIAGGRTLVRSLFNYLLRDHEAAGVVLDVGGGRNQDYLTFLETSRLKEVRTADIAHGGSETVRIDFEKDKLPYPDASVDTALAFNILEHIYEHRFLVGEIARVLKPGGSFIGFVPFLVNYHPDPHDYFRYTKEALAKIVEGAGFKDVAVKAVGGGPFAANFNNIVLSVPVVVRMAIFPFYYVLDRAFTAVRPASRERYPLGYLWTAVKR